MAFERYTLQKGNIDYPIRDLLKKKDMDIDEICALLNELNIKYNDLEDNLKQVLVKEYKTTRWRDEYSTVRLELLTSLAEQFGIEL